MGKTGRPRHPDVLTPREWEVLALLRERLTNDEIAQRLGITLDGAKYHVSQILSKLNVATREEAATWRPSERHAWWARWPLWAKITGAATVAAAATGIAVLSWGVLRTGGPVETNSVVLDAPSGDTFGPGSFDLTIFGEVVAIEGQVLTVRKFGSLGADVAIEITGDTTITRHGAPARFGDARVGQFIFAFLRESGPLPVVHQAVILRLDETEPDVSQNSTAFDPSAACRSIAPEEKRGPLAIGWQEPDVICWRDAEGESYYRIEGSVRYWSRSSYDCAILWVSDETPISVDLPENSTRFQLPEPVDTELTAEPTDIKEFRVELRALDANGETIALDGTALTKDPPLCESLGWDIVPPEDRTDIEMIDVTQARLFLPNPADAADCDNGDLDGSKAEAVIRAWLADHRAELARTSVWDGTQILVTCSYPSEEFMGRLVLYIGIPYSGFAYIAPANCQDAAKALPQNAPPPPECVTPPDLEPALEVDSHTIVVSPYEVLK